VNDTVALEVLSFLFVSQKKIIESLQQNPITLGPAACCLLQCNQDPMCWIYDTMCRDTFELGPASDIPRKDKKDWMQKVQEKVTQKTQITDTSDEGNENKKNRKRKQEQKPD
jgi:hypothetical protein